MGANWTQEQLQAITCRKRNLLVSAAAGSGKTAVLVERIIRMITDEEEPVDIDRLLVMTFTNAVAAEMRERIGTAIEKLLMASPENEHLQMQATLVHHAQITTIDSFCLNLIRTHFNHLDLDPSFRIGDEGELTLLRGDVMEKMLEEYYEKSEEAFLRFTETYAQGKGDKGIAELIFQVYEFARSNPWPKEWIAACRSELETRDDDALGQLPWMEFVVADIRRQVEELTVQLEESIEICREEETLSPYLPMLINDKRQLEAVLLTREFEELQSSLQNIIWDRLASVRSKEVDAEKKEYVTDCRSRVKKSVGTLQSLYCVGTEEEILLGIRQTSEAVGMLLTLAEDFSDRYRLQKLEKNVVDFGDLEHEALKVLYEVQDGVRVPSQAAEELGRRYVEILVDEYQDSNMVQEALVQAISRERFGEPNVFMVGDVKQSIYKFRLARPELFLDKYDTYSKEESLKQKIELHKNFRSRSEVLESVNEVFYRIMTKNLGNIHYTEDAALYPGAVFSDVEEGMLSAGKTELLMADSSQAEEPGADEEKAEFTAREMEAKMIASRIREWINPERGMMVWDGKQGEYRRLQYRDIVILLRSMSGWAETFLTVLMDEGIPAYAESRMGYFRTQEVETVLAMLAVVDNPMQDVPLAAVMHSPIGDLSDEELAETVALYKACTESDTNRGLYGAWQFCLRQGECGNWKGSPLCYEKLSRLHNMVQDLQRDSSWMPIHELLYRVYRKTGYYDFVSAMPAGSTRRANLDMLMEKAASYEKTSYKGLFHFIRYIENLKKFDTDFGEAATLGEEDCVVRIMSIHKSKGLEFPVVFLAGMSKSFNRRDVTRRVLIDADLGIGTDYVDLERRLKSSTLKKNAIRRKMELDNLGEELRVLYVAMTRAKEKLVMTAVDRSLEKKLEKFARVPVAAGQIPHTVLLSAGCYLDWVLMCLGSGARTISTEVIPVQALVGREVERRIRRQEGRDEVLSLDISRTYDEEVRNMLYEMKEYRYPFETDTRLHAAVSVSELKKLGQDTDETEEWTRYMEEAAVPTVPGMTGRGGVARGTAYHRALELLHFADMHSALDVERELNCMVEKGYYSEENRKLVRSEILWGFLSSELGKQMTLAEQQGRLHKEQQFVIGLSARDIGLGDSDELVLIQGIIDAYIEEEDGMILVDYKTDRVGEGGGEMLKNRYEKQLLYYSRALAQMTQKPVKTAVLYSLEMQEAIAVPVQ